MNVAKQPQQLALPVGLPPRSRLDDFEPGPNAQPLAAVRALADARGESFVYLWGGAGSGRSHLLAGACARVAENGGQAVYLPLAEPAQLSPLMCDGLEQADLVCLDEVQAIAGLADWEQALFGLFNRLRDAGRRLLVSADCGSAALPIRLPDLRSRLGWGLAFQLQSLSDDDKLRVLQRHAEQRGLLLAEDAARYLLRHHSRELRDLLGLLDRLDSASLAAQRRLTLPFVREQLAREQAAQ